MDDIKEQETEENNNEVATTLIKKTETHDNSHADKTKYGIVEASIQEENEDATNCNCGIVPEKNMIEITPANENVLEETGSVGKYVFAAGKLTPEFPSENIKREFNRVIGLPQNTQPSDAQFYDALKDNKNFYLTKSLCWIFEIGGIESYVVVPKNSGQLTTFINILNKQVGTEITTSNSNDDSGSMYFDTIVGKLGPMAPPEMCNGRTLPLLKAYRLENETVTDFVSFMNAETKLDTALLTNLFLNLITLIDNDGSSDEHRAVNSLVFNSVDLYRLLGDTLPNSSSNTQIFPFKGVTAKSVDGSDGRKKVEVVFQYENPVTSAQEYLNGQVDVTDMFPFVSGSIATGKP
ncbi:MAG: hypothetical protein HQK84_12295 [Nitrospinae bacterium]|nr:hypothetical protein [Nitrospinota bacterium]